MNKVDCGSITTSSSRIMGLMNPEILVIHTFVGPISIVLTNMSKESHYKYFTPTFLRTKFIHDIF